MATTRLRKAFRYPDDSGDEHDREELDEEEQELVIQQLQMQNEKQNLQFTIIFAVLPLLAAVLIFVPLIFSGSSSLSEWMLSLLSVLSLVASAYTMKYCPILPPDPKGKRPMRNPDLITAVRKYIVPANAALCAILGLVYLFAGSVLTYLVPGAMFATILITRRVMVSVDLKHLENLRYEYKGA